MEMAGNKTLTLALLVLAACLWQQLDATKIAYKKPIQGKASSYVKERRYKPKTEAVPRVPLTESSYTTEAVWPASVDFVVHTTPKVELWGTTTATSWDSEQQGSSTIIATTPGSSTAIGSTTTASLASTLPSPPLTNVLAPQQPVPCTCGVFLSSQLQNGLPEKPLILNELDRVFPCNAIGRKQCQTKCLEAIVQHLPNSANIVCATLGHDCHKERAYLFVKNCQNQWWNTNLQAGREYCCKDGLPYRCPLLG